MSDPLNRPTLADLEDALARCTSGDLDLVTRAYQIAQRAHHGQLRDEGTPYIEHPLRVALIVAGELGRCDTELICAALLHDVVEDTSVTLAQIQGVCGDRVAHFVELLTKERIDDPAQKRSATRLYLQRIAGDSEEVLLLKLADRLDNLRSVALIPDWEKRRKYLLETYWQYLPIAQRGGDFFYERYKQLLAGYMRTHSARLQLHVDDFPELTGGAETRRQS